MFQHFLSSFSLKLIQPFTLVSSMKDIYTIHALLVHMIVLS